MAAALPSIQHTLAHAAKVRYVALVITFTYSYFIIDSEPISNH